MTLLNICMKECKGVHGQLKIVKHHIVTAENHDMQGCILKSHLCVLAKLSSRKEDEALVTNFLCKKTKQKQLALLECFTVEKQIK